MDDKLNLRENERQVHYDSSVCIVTLCFRILLRDIEWLFSCTVM